MFAGMTMADLMPAHGKYRNDVKYSDVAPTLFRKREELQCFAADFTPVGNGDAGHDGESCQGYQRELPGINPPSVFMKPGQKIVRVHRRKGYLSQITIP